jgi:hypothetical protein
MAYSEKDFSGCVINPLQKDLLAKNKGLSDLVPVITSDDEESTTVVFDKTEIENILRYVIIVYDPQSALVKNERDLGRRKEQAADLAELRASEDYRQSVYSCEHLLMVPLIVGYLMNYAKNKEWAAICVFEQTFWENIKQLMQPVRGTDSKAELQAVEKKSKLKSEVDDDIVRLQQYYSKFLGEDRSLEEKAKPKMTPEGMAKMFSK